VGNSFLNAIIIGASSGIGRELAIQLSAKGYNLGLTARRVDLLNDLANEINTESFILKMDVADIENTMKGINDLIEKMGGIDLIIINAGVGFNNPELNWEKEKTTIDVNVAGFCAAANASMKYFISRGGGHLVGISSLAALRGNRYAPAYSASKAFLSNYLEGLRHKVVKEKLPVTITDIKAGYINTAMAQGEYLFWVAPVPKAVKQIVKAIEKKKPLAYITGRWRVIAWIYQVLPKWIYYKA
jgi:short-subunit dehydrogenase